MSDRPRFALSDIAMDGKLPGGYHRFAIDLRRPGHHVCRCRFCVPELFPPDERVGPAHIARRLGDLDNPELRGARVYLDGTPLAHCHEVICGETGIAVVAALGTETGLDVPHACQTCRRDQCAEVLRGVVEIRGA